jgi:hypothetical protein
VGLLPGELEESLAHFGCEKLSELSDVVRPHREHAVECLVAEGPVTRPKETHELAEEALRGDVDAHVRRRTVNGCRAHGVGHEVHLHGTPLNVPNTRKLPFSMSPSLASPSLAPTRRYLSIHLSNTMVSFRTST